MQRLRLTIALVAVSFLHHGLSAQERDAAPIPPSALRLAIQRVVRMPNDAALARAARAQGMRIQNLSWEDSARYLGSSVGPNISDLTLEVHETISMRSGRDRTRTSLLPVLRYPNFTDRTADLPADQFWVRVGNQSPNHATPGAGGLESVPLREVLAHVRTYLSDPTSLRGTSDDFTAPRDTHYLVSAQHVFVPLPEDTRVSWAPVLFNYQSDVGSPAVLCLVITREGTSIQVIENRPDRLHPNGWGQRLYFNHAGQKSLFTAERRSDVAHRVETGHAEANDGTALEEGSDMVMIVQVPLRQVQTYRDAPSTAATGGLSQNDYMASEPAPQMERSRANGGGGRASGDVERAVVGHASDEGPMIEAHRLRLRRDRRFPIRITVQFYRATSNGVVSEADLAAASAQIQRVYNDASFVGSLVVGPQNRPTAWAHHRGP